MWRWWSAGFDLGGLSCCGEGSAPEVCGQEVCTELIFPPLSSVIFFYETLESSEKRQNGSCLIERRFIPLLKCTLAITARNHSADSSAVYIKVKISLLDEELLAEITWLSPSEPCAAFNATLQTNTSSRNNRCGGEGAHSPGEAEGCPTSMPLPSSHYSNSVPQVQKAGAS